MPKTVVEMSQCQYNQGLTEGSIDGIDIRAGMRRVGGNPAIYARMLQMFCDTHAGDALALMAALGNGERDNAERIAHSVNGVAANLGAQTLSDAAARLERALAARREDDDLIDGFVDALSQTLASTRAALAQAAQPARASLPATVEPAGQVLAGLAACLDDDSGETIDYLEQHMAALRTALGDAAFDQLAQAIKRFDFATARQLLAARA
jgi:two-component system sensor histidine kinase/response regulator